MWPWPKCSKSGRGAATGPLSIELISPRKEIAEIKQRVFNRINEDRRSCGLKPVQWDELAAQVGDAHCTEMLEHGYQSHWNLQGFKPYHRYSFAGGTDSVHENGSRVDYYGDIGNLKVLADLAIKCHASMMAELPPDDGHRRNILNPFHTHVGIGLAYNQSGLRMTEEFVQRCVKLDSWVPSQATFNRTLKLQGRTLSKEHRISSIAIYYEPFPRPMSVEELNKTDAYTLPDKVDNEYPRCASGVGYSDGSTGSILIHPDGSFECPIRLKRKSPGLYTICIWLKDNIGNGIPASHLTVWVKK